MQEPANELDQASYWVGIDPGSVRVGVAVAEASSPVATPLSVLPTEPRDTLPQRLIEALGERAPRGLVVGLPLNQYGGEGEAARLARGIGELLAGALGVAAEYIDERFTTRHATSLRREAGVRAARRKRGIDAAAAAGILQVFLERSRATM